MRNIPEKLYNLQVLRAFSCLVVALGHIKVPLPLFNEDPEGIFGHGPCGVDVFFVISGFIMVYTTRRGDISPSTFIQHRLARIVPLYYLTTLAIFAACLLAPQYFLNTNRTVSHLFSSLLFLPSDSMPTNPVGWTLNFEMLFYALFAVGLFFSRSGWRAALPCIVLPGFVLFGLLTASDGVITGFLTEPITIDFVLGIAIALTFNRLPLLPSPVYMLVAASVAIFMFACPYPLQGHSSFFRVVVWGIPAALLVFSAISLEARGHALRWSPVILIGEASYAIYLTHLPIAQLSRKFPMPMEGTLAASVMVIATMAVIILVGIAAYLAIDKPATRALRRMSRTLGAPRPTPQNDSITV